MKPSALSLLAIVLTALLSGCVQPRDPGDNRNETSEEDVAELGQGLTPPGGDQCASVNAAAIQDVLDHIEVAQTAAALTLAAHPNETHTYHAQTMNDCLDNAHAEVQAILTWLQNSVTDGDPNTTDPAEGGSIQSAFLNTRYSIDGARTNAQLSVVYLYDYDAYDVYEEMAFLTELMNDIATRGGRCYMRSHTFP